MGIRTGHSAIGLIVALFAPCLALSQTKPASDEQPVRVYEVNKRVSSFPDKDDFTTPEAAYVVINRAMAGGQEGKWREISVSSLASRLPPAVAGRAKPARSGRVKTGHLEELVIRDKAIFGPWWTEEARHGESSQDGRRTVDTSTSGAGLVVSTDWPGTGDPSGHGQAILCSGGVR